MRNTRHARGSMLILTVAVTAFIAAVFVIFLLNFVRFTGSHQEQRTAIEAASIAAAKALSRVVVEDQNFGFVSLSNQAPIGPATKAGDNYYMPVTGINTLLATIRLDLILADVLKDKTLKDCALADYDNAMRARQTLADTLQAAIQPGAKNLDIFGKPITPLDDAVAAYNSNQVRLAGGTTRLVPGSMKLTLGCVPGLTTNTRIPYPSNFAQLDSDQQDNLFYKSYLNIPYAGKDFVFAATADNITLVDFRKFQTTLPNLPYFTPAIVKCEADEEFIGTQTGPKASRFVHAASCAQPSSLADNRPAPGRLVLSLPNGSVNSITNFRDVFTYAGINKSPSDYIQTPLNSDCPSDQLTDVLIPVIGKEHAPIGQVLRVALYDWLRRCGSRLNIQSFQDAFVQPLGASSGSHANFLEMKSDGTVSLKEIDPAPVLLPVSHKQWISVTGVTVQSQNQFYDVYIRDYVNQPGRIRGGIHGGEPLPQVVPPPPSQPVNTIQFNANNLAIFPMGPPGGAIRPTYQTNGIAVEIRIQYHP